MTISIITTDAGAEICIAGELTIYTAAEAREILLQALHAHADLYLNTEAVAEIDTAGVQLLLLVQREAKRMNKTLRRSRWSPAIQQVIGLLCITELKESMAAAQEPTILGNGDVALLLDVQQVVQAAARVRALH